MALSIKLLLDDRHPKLDGTVPVVLRLIYNRTMSQLASGIYVVPKDWDPVDQRIKPRSKAFQNVTRINNMLQKKKADLHDYAMEYLQDNNQVVVTASQIKKGFNLKLKGNLKNNVLEYILEIVEEKKSMSKLGTARSYRDLYKKLKKFTHQDKITFAEINHSFLKALEASHIASGSNYGSLGVYMRTLRAVLNRAIKSGLIRKASYPFEKYQIPRSEPLRRALSEKDLKTLIKADFKKRQGLERARKYYLASFYLQGMNWMDMCLLTKDNVEGDFERIRYKRHKTGKSFSIRVFPQLIDILQSLNPDYKNSKFVFPMLHQVEDRYYYRSIDNKRRRLNKNLKTIAELLEIPEFTIYSARHTWATLSKIKGVPTAVIQEGLGHQTESITQAYLSSFENEVVDGYNEMVFEGL